MTIAVILNIFSFFPKFEKINGNRLYNTTQIIREAMNELSSVWPVIVV
jgi:hypothetical protein